MIDSSGNLRCDGCGKRLGDNLLGSVEIVCPRCHRFNKFLVISNTDIVNGLDKVQEIIYKEVKV